VNAFTLYHVEGSGHGTDERWYKFSVVHILFEYLKGNISSQNMLQQQEGTAISIIK